VKKVAVVGGDVIPNSVNWGTVWQDDYEASWIYAVKQITGINQTITLKINRTANTGGTLYYKVAGTSLSLPGDNIFDASHPVNDYSMVSIADNGTFTVQNNQWVAFAVVATGSSTSGSFTVTVRNASNGDAILDTFDAQWLVFPP
jgi:hypothetical protein